VCICSENAPRLGLFTLRSLAALGLVVDVQQNLLDGFQLLLYPFKQAQKPESLSERDFEFDDGHVQVYGVQLLLFVFLDLLVELDLNWMHDNHGLGSFMLVLLRPEVFLALFTRQNLVVQKHREVAYFHVKQLIWLELFT
jgi:hypothetical protein